MINSQEFPRTPPRSPGYSLNFSSEKCKGKMTLCNKEAYVTKSHIQYKNELSSEVDNYYGDGKLIENIFIRHGLGTYYYIEGCKYFGNWEENKKVGIGVFIYSNNVVSFGERDINNQIKNCLIYWPDSSEGFKQSFIGNIENKSPMNGLFYVKDKTTRIDSNEMSHYLYCGKRNNENKMDDDEAILYDFNRNFMFIGIIKNDTIIMGYEIILSTSFSIQNIIFIIRNIEKNQIKEIIKQEDIAIADINLIYRRSNAFIYNYLKKSTLVEYLNTAYCDIRKYSKDTIGLMPSPEIIDKLKKRSVEIKTLINKSIIIKEV